MRIGALSLALSALGSREEASRFVAYKIVAQFWSVLNQDSSFKFRVEFKMMLSVLQNSVDTPFRRIPTLIAVFFAKIVSFSFFSFNMHTLTLTLTHPHSHPYSHSHSHSHSLTHSLTFIQHNTHTTLVNDEKKKKKGRHHDETRANAVHRSEPVLDQEAHNQLYGTIHPCATTTTLTHSHNVFPLLSCSFESNRNFRWVNL